jgi:hypothetical protein
MEEREQDTKGRGLYKSTVLHVEFILQDTAILW